MSQIREKLRKAIDQQRRAQPRPPSGPRDARAEAAFRPVREAAQELKDELSRVPDLKIAIEPDGVWIELYDKHLWFSYDADQGVFVGDEVDSLWIEGGLREETYRWSTAEACTEAMIEACARYMALAEALARLRSRP
jgi:hypothetical protein